MIPEEAKKIFVNKYESFGSDRFYKFLINYAENKIATDKDIKKEDKKSIIISPEIEFMDYHNDFMSFFREENKTVYLDIAKLFRRAAHKIYFIMLKKSLCPYNPKFLNVVPNEVAK
jgi:hypothetical protein